MRIKRLIFDHRNLFLLFITLLLLSACNKQAEDSLPGYVEGKYIYISANFNGILKVLYVTPGQEIKVNQPLFALENLPESADLIAAKARVEEALNLKNKSQEAYDLQNIKFKRNQYLLKQDIISKEEFDNISANYHQAYADMRAAEENLVAKKADLNKAEWVSGQKVMNAPITGLVFDVYFSAGELVSSGVPVLSLLTPNDIKIIFFVSESMLSKLKLNQMISVNCDSCRQPFSAKINYISNKAEYTPPVIYSNEERAKLVYRIEALPLLKDVLYNIHPGQPVVVTIHF